MANDDTQYEDGDDAYGADDYEAAYRMWKPDANAGDAEAQYSLGILNYYGEGVKKDGAEGVKWFRLAADQGHPAAQFYMGRAYDDGIGVETDDVEAVRWYRAAAEQGQRVAQYNLARMLELGEGADDDIWEATELYEEAASQGYAKAQFCLGRIYEEGLGVKPDQTKAIEYYELAAEQDHIEAQLRLGLMYNAGFAVEYDRDLAQKWLRMAAEQGNSEAHYYLAGTYLDSEFPDWAKAEKWYRLAAKLDHPGAMYQLGRMAQKGTYGSVDLKAAERWFARAVKGGDARAARELRKVKSPIRHVYRFAAPKIAYIIHVFLMFVALMVVQEFAMQADWYAENIGVFGLRFDVIRGGVDAVMGWL